MKLFLVASAEVRAKRRLAELVSRGMVESGDIAAQESTYRQVLQVTTHESMTSNELGRIPWQDQLRASK